MLGILATRQLVAPLVSVHTVDVRLIFVLLLRFIEMCMACGVPCSFKLRR